VQDLLSLIRFVLQPGDDLALAELITSPMIGLAPEDIRALRGGDGRRSLWEALRQSDDPAWQAPRALLQSALAMADQRTPLDFLQAVLAAGGRARLYARLGREAEDGIDMLLSQALAFEQVAPPTLQGFLRWIGESDVEVKRDPESAPGRVRIMTVHGAKGLQAPIVVLADAMRRNRKPDSLVKVPMDGVAGTLPLIFGNAERRPARVSALWVPMVAASDAEEMRLFYVALTRAETMLVVAGQAPLKPKDENARSWHVMVHDALVALDARTLAVPGEGWKGDGLVLADAMTMPATASAESPAPAVLPVPPWAQSPAPAEPSPARPFTPSAPAPDDAPLPPPGPGQLDAAPRGVMLHRLFERLPALPAGERETAARAATRAAGFGEAETDEMVATVLAILDAPGFAALFHPDALAEAPLAGVVDGHAVAGTVDRLVVTERDVLVIDYKTGRHVPSAAGQVHPSQLRQMAAYRRVLTAAFPQHAVRAALLFTSGPRLIMLPDTLLDRHWPPAPATA
jgi:ATP-dependent helicase/nuclease subunit A